MEAAGAAARGAKRAKRELSAKDVAKAAKLEEQLVRCVALPPLLQ